MIEGGSSEGAIKEIISFPKSQRPSHFATSFPTPSLPFPSPPPEKIQVADLWERRVKTLRGW